MLLCMGENGGDGRSPYYLVYATTPFHAIPCPTKKVGGVMYPMHGCKELGQYEPISFSKTEFVCPFRVRLEQVIVSPQYPRKLICRG